jgi:hypothetical protein
MYRNAYARILYNQSVHGGWSSWETWGKCSVSCGVGMRNRRRLCTNPRPERFGNHCFGDSTEYELCYNRLCAGNKPVCWFHF